MLEYDVPSNGTRRRSYGEGFLHEIRVHGDIDPNHATEISEDARVAVSRKRARSLVRCTRGGEPEGRWRNKGDEAEAVTWYDELEGARCS
jgi:hypothetical protein